jgi:hypothetical protein
MPIVSWNEHYPSQQSLKGEVQFMLEADLEALFEAIPESDFERVYEK